MPKLEQFLKSFGGGQADRIVRSIPADSTGERILYLTFDDGPDPVSTPAVLDVLAEAGVKATFFVIAEKAVLHPELLRRMIREGHAVGNHSLDHRYFQYFRGKNKIRNWIQDAEEKISMITGAKTVGFRPPAGVWTPELRSVLNELKVPLILWSVRFFDTRFVWTIAKAEKSWAKTRSGAIVLLHDRKLVTELPLFLKTLSEYLVQARGRGWQLRPLGRHESRADAGFFR